MNIHRTRSHRRTWRGRRRYAKSRLITPKIGKTLGVEKCRKDQIGAVSSWSAFGAEIQERSHSATNSIAVTRGLTQPSNLRLQHAYHRANDTGLTRTSMLNRSFLNACRRRSARETRNKNSHARRSASSDAPDRARQKSRRIQRGIPVEGVAKDGRPAPAQGWAFPLLAPSVKPSP